MLQAQYQLLNKHEMHLYKKTQIVECAQVLFFFHMENLGQFEIKI